MRVRFEVLQRNGGKRFQNATASDVFDLVYLRTLKTQECFERVPLEFPKSGRSLTHSPSFLCYSSSFCLFSFSPPASECSPSTSHPDGETTVQFTTDGASCLCCRRTFPVQLHWCSFLQRRHCVFLHATSLFLGKQSGGLAAAGGFLGKQQASEP